MKKIWIAFTAGLLALAMTACTPSSDPNANTDADATGATAATEAASEELPSNVADLAGKKIGVQQGTTGDLYVEDEIPGAQVERFSKGSEAVLALKQGKVDAVVIDDQPAKVYVAQNDDLQMLEEPLTEEDYAICVSKDKPELTAAMNQAIAELKADGTLQNLLDYYIGQVEGAAPYESPADVDRSKGTLRMATNAAFPPYEYREEGKVCGLDADFARAICDKMGYDLEIQDIEFDAIIVSVQSGKADFGAAGMTVTEDRLKNIDFTDSYCTGRQVIIIKK